MEQSWVEKYFNQNCKDPVVAPIRIRYLRVRKTSWDELLKAWLALTIG